MPFSTKKCNVLKQHKKGSTISPPSGTYTKKPNQSCKYCHIDLQKVQLQVQADHQAIHR